MNNIVVEKNYNEFVQHASDCVKKGVDSLWGYKNKGKEYQDEIVKIFHDSVIQLNNRCDLTDEKKISVISDILNSSHVVDDELYKLVVDRKDEYKNLFDGNFWKRTNIIKESLRNNSKIDEFVNNRIEKSFQYTENQYNNRLELMNEKLWMMKEKLSHVHHKNKYKPALKKLYDYYDGDRAYLENEYQERKNDYWIGVKKFRNNILEMLQKYVLSRENSDKTLKKEYVRIFLWDKLKYHINFKQGSEYMFQLSTIPSTKNTSEDLYDVFIQKYEQEISEPKKKKEKQEKQEILLKKMMPEIKFSE